MPTPNLPSLATPTLDGPCPCGTGSPYATCCGRLHRGPSRAATAEQLMRARYSAHAVHDEAYLLATWDPATRPDHVPFDPAVRWTRLEVLGTTGGNLLDAEGTVEFLAHYVDTDGNGLAKPETHHELSRFVRNDQRWAYLGVVGEPLA